MVLGDAEKCFDKLDLNSCLNELHKINVDCAEIAMIESMNTNIKAIVDTNGHQTNQIDIKEAVRQGTIFGGILCSLETDKVNVIRQPTYTMVHPEIPIESLVYVDDILGHGSEKTIKGTIENLRGLEIEKKVTFGIEKTHIMKMQYAKNKLEDLELTVRQGQITNSNVEKYVGILVNEKGDNKDRIVSSKNRSHVLSKLINTWGSPYKVGNLAIQTRLFLVNNLAMQSIFHTAETWTNLTKTDKKTIEGIHRNLLTSILEIENSTPYVGILVETGEWPIHQTIHYKKLMLFQHIIASDEKRLAKQVLIGQERAGLPNNWYAELKQIGELYGIKIDVAEVLLYKKSQWKAMVKAEIDKWVLKYYHREIDQKKKLRFLKKPKELILQKYLQLLPFTVSQTILRTKLNMVKAKANYKGTYTDQTCNGCQNKEESTEHLFKCWRNGWITGMELDSRWVESDSLEQLEKMSFAVECIERMKETTGEWRMTKE